MGKFLTEKQVEGFRTTGFVQPFSVATTALMKEMRSKLESFEQAQGGALRGSQRFKNHLLFKWLSDFIRTPRILDAVEDLIGPDILVWSTDWWIKESRSPQFVSWHQDSQYWGLDSDRLVTVWVALSPATVQSGCCPVVTLDRILLMKTRTMMTTC